jgi:dTDP-4-amino-4,6-dideoxygalactose transaminase
MHWDIGTLSFHATNPFQIAVGGALVLRDPAVEARADLLRNFGIAGEERVLLPAPTTR